MDKLEQAIKATCRRLWITDSSGGVVSKTDIEKIARQFYDIAVEETRQWLSTEIDDYFDCERGEIKHFIEDYKSHMYGKQE